MRRNSFCAAPKQHISGGFSYGKSIPSSKSSNSCSWSTDSGLTSWVLRVRFGFVAVVVDFVALRRFGEVSRLALMDALGGLNLCEGKGRGQVVQNLKLGGEV